MDGVISEVQSTSSRYKMQIEEPISDNESGNHSDRHKDELTDVSDTESLSLPTQLNALQRNDVINIEDEDIVVKTDSTTNTLMNIADGRLFLDDDIELPPMPIQGSNIGNNDEDFLLITDSATIPVVNIAERGYLFNNKSQAHVVDIAVKRTPSRKSNARQNRPKKASQDDAYIAIMREKTKVLKELASTSTVLNAAYNLESPDKTITQQYFDVYSAEIELLPSDLQLKCQREVHQAVTDIIHKFQDQAEEMKKTRACRKLL